MEMINGKVKIDVMLKLYQRLFEWKDMLKDWKT